MLQARSEQPGDTPSPEAGAALQQPQNNLQPTGSTGSNVTSTPQTTPSVTQQQLQAPNLRVGNTQTLIANSTVAQQSSGGGDSYAGWLWAAIPVLIFVAIAWRIRKMTPSAPVTSSGASAATAVIPPRPKLDAQPAQAAAEPVAEKPKPKPTKKPKLTAQSNRRQRKHKR